MSTPGTSGATVRPSRPSWRRSDISASPAPGYCTLTATSRPSCQRPLWTWPMLAAAVGPPSSQTSWSRQSGPRSLRDLVAHGLGRHRRRGVLQPGQLLAVGAGDLLGQRGLEHAQRLPELHRAALELAQGPEQLLGGALLDLGQHRLGRGAAQPLAEADRAPAGVPQRRAASRAVRAAALRGSSVGMGPFSLTVHVGSVRLVVPAVSRAVSRAVSQAVSRGSDVKPGGTDRRRGD